MRQHYTYVYVALQTGILRTTRRGKRPFCTTLALASTPCSVPISVWRTTANRLEVLSKMERDEPHRIQELIILHFWQPHKHELTAWRVSRHGR